jgi:hypothetical protein
MVAAVEKSIIMERNIKTTTIIILVGFVPWTHIHMLLLQKRQGPNDGCLLLGGRGSCCWAVVVVAVVVFLYYYYFFCLP